jgi:hypothetical protein
VKTLHALALQWAIQKAQANLDILALRLEFNGDEAQRSLVAQIQSLEAIINALREQLDAVTFEGDRSERS